MLANFRPGRAPVTLLAMLAAGALLAACSSDGNPAGPGAADDESGSNPPPGPEPTMYNVVIFLDRIEVLGTCEGDPSNPGEFEYEVAAYGRNEADVYLLRYHLFGSFLGEDGESYRLSRFTNFPVPAGKNYYVGFKATDDDPWPNEDEYVGYAQEVNRAGGQLEYSHRLQIGDNGCGLALYFTAREDPIY